MLHSSTFYYRLILSLAIIYRCDNFFCLFYFRCGIEYGPLVITCGIYPLGSPAKFQASRPSLTFCFVTSTTMKTKKIHCLSLLTFSRTWCTRLPVVRAYRQQSGRVGFRRLTSTQFIAALGDPTAHSGTNAQEWGIWKVDPGPRGVWLRDYTNHLQTTPAGWIFDPRDFWIEEHGLLMEAPQFPVPKGRYLVTGDREVTTGLTVYGDGRWELDEGTLHDVTHLPCRSARYKPMGDASPAQAQWSDFPVKPGTVMPSIPGTEKQDYAVVFVIGLEDTEL